MRTLSGQAGSGPIYNLVREMINLPQYRVLNDELSFLLMPPNTLPVEKPEKEVA